MRTSPRSTLPATQRPSPGIGRLRRTVGLALVPSAIGPLELEAPHRVEMRAQRLAHERRAVQLQPARGPVGPPAAAPLRAPPGSSPHCGICSTIDSTVNGRRREARFLETVDRRDVGWLRAWIASPDEAASAVGEDRASASPRSACRLRSPGSGRRPAPWPPGSGRRGPGAAAPLRGCGEPLRGSARPPERRPLQPADPRQLASIRDPATLSKNSSSRNTYRR